MMIFVHRKWPHSSIIIPEIYTIQSVVQITKTFLDVLILILFKYYYLKTETSFGFMQKRRMNYQQSRFAFSSFHIGNFFLLTQCAIVNGHNATYNSVTSTYYIVFKHKGYVG